jgi:MFS family permease
MTTDPHLAHGDRHKWLVLSNTTLGVLAASITGSIILISLPAVFRGIGIHPLDPGNTNTLLWTIMGYLVVTSVLVVTFGRLGDMFGRARIYNIGFAIFALASIALSLMPTGDGAAAYLVWMRIIQGIGGAMLTATSTAILVDAFPPHQRGLALGINTMAIIAGQFIGLIVGGILADLNWRLVFWLNVPIGVIGTIWGFLSLRDHGTPKKRGPLDWWGNITFAVGLVLVLVGINDGIQPDGANLMSWGTPKVLAELIVGLLFLLAFILIEQRVKLPMFDLNLLKIRPFAAGISASFLTSIARGGLQFMLIIWLQGIWLPLHGYSFEQTPLWAGIFMLPLTVGVLLAGPLAGILADRYGSHRFAAAGMLLGALTFLGLMLLDADFSYPLFATLLFLNGLSSGLFSAPNGTQIMNAVPASERGQASGLRATSMNAGQVMSIGVFFTLMIIGLAWSLPGVMEQRLIAQGLPADIATQVASAPPVASLFAAFLGYNPMGELIPAAALSALTPDQVAVITGKQFFPDLLSEPFMVGIKIAFTISLVLYLLAAIVSFIGGSTRKQEAVEERKMELAEQQAA